MKPMKAIIIFCIIFAITACSAEAVTINLGFSKIVADKYDQAYENEIEIKKADLNKQDSSIMYSELGIYGAFQRSLVGVSLKAFRGAYHSNNKESVGINAITLGGSYKYFFSGKANLGLFFRGDLGIYAVNLVATETYNNALFPHGSGSYHFEYDSWGAAVEIGYSWMFTKLFGMDLHVNHTSANTKFGYMNWTSAGFNTVWSF